MHLCGHASNSWQCCKLVPKKFRVAKPARSGVTKQRVLFRKDKRFSATFERLGIAIKNGFASADGRGREMANFDCDRCARRETNEVLGIRQRESFVEIVYAPDEPAFGITPRAEIGYMQVSNSEHDRSFAGPGAQLRKKLHPAIERRAEERKRILRHQAVLLAKIALENRKMARQPDFVLARCLVDARNSSHLRELKE